MTVITEADLIESVADALQFISYYHPMDYIRALGVALPYALANTLFGGTAEYVALKFKDSGFERGFYWYVTGMIAVSLIVYLRMKDTRTNSQIVED